MFYIKKRLQKAGKSQLSPVIKIMNSFNSIHVVNTIDHKHLLQIHLLSQLILEYLSRPKNLEYT